MNSNTKGHTDQKVIQSTKIGLKTRFPFRRLLILILPILILGCVGTMIIAEAFPYLGAQVANGIREVFGPGVVAELESIVFRLQDILKNWWYQFAPIRAESPWANPTSNPESTSYFVTAVAISPSTTQSPTQAPVPGKVTPTPRVKTQQLPTTDHNLTKTLNPSATPTAHPWVLPTLEPFGTLQGEGIWQPYLYDQDENVVAYRTYLQPDPDRPYTIVAVVAFDLNRTRLHFVLGFNEPSVPDGPRGDGLIPEKDRQSGTLLAAFNGGFRAANGHFGAMADGTVALPPKEEFATLGIYENGKLKIGEWGTEIVDSPDLRSWRQNCRLIIDDGAISARVYNNSITDWGASINNQTVTRRSGLGLDKSAKTLYYFAGPSLSMPILADTMLAVGVHNGMLLDINHFWVHFTAIRTVEGGLLAEPLMPDDMIDHVDRYLGASPVDFFYITALESR